MSSNRKLIVLGAIALAVAALVVVLRSGKERPGRLAERPVEVAQRGEVESADLAQTAAAPTEADTERVPGRVPAAATEPNAESTAETADEVSEPTGGRVIDGTGAPVAGAEVTLRRRDWSAGVWEPAAGSPTAITDDSGLFEMPGDAGFGQAAVTSERYATVVGTPWPPRGGPRQPTVVVGERSSYAGIVVDPEGNALPGAQVHARLDSGVLRKLFQGEERNLEETWSQSTGAAGEFAAIDIGWIPGMKLIVILDPFERQVVPLDPGDHRDLEIVLERALGGEGLLHGRVVRADGGSTAGAQVAYAGGGSVAAAPDGTFALDLGDGAAPGLLLAVLEGFLPARLEIADPPSATADSRSTPVVLELGSSALAISGVVIDAAGEPVPKAWVWTEDGTPFSGGRAIEDFAAIDKQFDGVGRRRCAEVDSDGRFEVTGLLDADYDLHAVHPVTFQVATLAGVAAGARDVQFIFDDGFTGVRVAGQVLFRNGDPVPNARLYPQLDRRNPSRSGRTPFLVHSGRSTDAMGRFEFDSLHTAGLSLWVTGEEIGRTTERIMVDLELCADPENIEIRVPHIVRFEVVLHGDPDEADRFGVLDGDENDLMLHYILSGAQRTRSGTGPRMKLSAGRSEVISCSEDARTLVLYLRGEEVRRVPLRLKVGELEVLEL